MRAPCSRSCNMYQCQGLLARELYLSLFLVWYVHKIAWSPLSRCFKVHRALAHNASLEAGDLRVSVHF